MCNLTEKLETSYNQPGFELETALIDAVKLLIKKEYLTNGFSMGGQIEFEDAIDLSADLIYSLQQKAIGTKTILKAQ